jgi:hypothetical protein
MPPENSGFMAAAYVVAAVIVVGYAISLAVRVRSERRRSRS